MEALPEALLLEQRASFMEDPSRQHLWAYLPQPFRLMWQFFAIAGAMEPWQHFFFVKEIQKGSVSPTRPSATPTSCTWIGHANADRARFFQVRALVEHISPRSTTCLHKTELERKRTRSILQTSFFFERKNERERDRERELQWRERVVAHASVGHTSSGSATCLHYLLPSWSKRAKKRDFSLHSFFFFERKTLRGLQWRERVVEKI